MTPTCLHRPSRPLRLLGVAGLIGALTGLIGPAASPAQAQQPVLVELTRIEGADRYATAAAIARATFPSATSVYLGRGDAFPDALAANYAAGFAGAPILLSFPGQVPQVTLDAISALGATTVHLLGGTGALGSAVESTLRSRGLTVTRTSGEDRFATAAAIARGPGPAVVGLNQAGVRTAILSSGRNPFDAISAGGLVYAKHFPQLLTEADSLPAATAAALNELAIKHVIVTGGTGVIAAAIEQQLNAAGIATERIAGGTRVDTSVALADMAIDRYGFSASHVDVATLINFPDALAAGPHVGANRSTLLLALSPEPPPCDFIRRRAETLTDGHVFGGEQVMPEQSVIALEGGCPAPGSPDVVVNGHGFGHGRGLGQWGANGYASTGVGATEILQHFYSNTTGAIVDLATSISVRLIAQDGVAPRVTSGKPYTVGGIGFGPGDAAWVTPDPAGWIVHGATAAGGGCVGPETFTSAPVADPTFASTVATPGNDVGSMLALCDGGGGVPRYYRGGFRSALDGGALRFVNVLPLEQYLRGVVPRESPASWPAAALQAQAIAARSYALAENRHPYAQTCDTTSCQVYSGVALGATRLEHDNTDAAILATAGVIRRMASNGAIARTEFSASTGGQTAGGTFPSVIDHGDAIATNPHRNWTVTLPGAAFAAKYAVGTVLAVEVVARTSADGGLRAATVRITGTSGSVDRTGDEFRRDWALKSTWIDAAVAS